MSLHLYNENRTYVGRHISICVFGFLLLMAFNYLNFNLYGRNDLLLAAGRILSSLMLVYLILNHPRMQISSLGFLYLAFLAFILGESKSLIPINVIFIINIFFKNNLLNKIHLA